MIGGISIDDIIVMHLEQCDNCRMATEHLLPKGLGQRTGLCDTYLHLQIMRADYEGKVNNIVAHTEVGDEAPRGKPLQ